MSLINDALKRASQSAAPTAPVVAGVKNDQALRPVEYKKPAPFGTILVVGVALAGVLSVGAWLFFRSPEGANARNPGVEQPQAQNRQPEPERVQANTGNVNPAPEETKTVAAAQLPARNVEPGVAASQAQGTGVIPQTPDVSATTTPAVPPTPVYKLQGIFYRPSRPMAMINGRNVVPGDKVANAQVVSIQRDSVTLSVDGQTKVLTLSQNN